MSLLYHTGDKEYALPKDRSYDVDEKKFYSISYRPETWVAGKEYVEGVDVVIPSTPNGFLYECSSGGISDATEPGFGTKTKGVTPDNTVEWKAKPYTLLLNTGDSITQSTWTGLNGETIDNESIVGGIHTKFRLTGITDVEAKNAIVKNHIFVTRANSDPEEFDTTLIIPIVKK